MQSVRMAPIIDGLLVVLSMLNNVQFVMSHPTHPGNIGAAARAMKNMGLSQLSLINPKQFPCAEATQRASGAQDILANAGVYDSLDQAIAGSRLVVGTSARSRTLPWPMLEPRELAEKIAQEPSTHPVAILFGTENSGLTNSELQLCHYHVAIPANPNYSSLNIASAMQLIAYELRMAALKFEHLETASEAEVDPGELPATAEQMDQMIKHFEQVLESTGYLDPVKPKMLELRLRRLFGKAQVTDSEFRMLRGILASIKKFE
ncbi:RNA methyltransferase [Pleionea sp. CnH1-48]|uniref:RNA methyltransferase n=1 Tax=Pleionea sp. CnH1-48 TaxID=2954494 RepID=UPI0020974EBA|nr:RNA methyltransferase [Pleionea sp. CnH1-48]MCO7226875.1 RNA methyltransferase [Pleionea sp. CnH1-48]